MNVNRLTRRQVAAKAVLAGLFPNFNHHYVFLVADGVVSGVTDIYPLGYA